ncbi:hypothetical protein H4R33_006877 [Dimargaris cristalligena]|nr:hypothetical protein H4R33_006877 [Dimargaris cristalligena]
MTEEFKSNGWNPDRFSKLSQTHLEIFEDHYQLLQDRLSPDAKILDVGCGEGVLTEKLQEKFSRVVGVDISPDMAEGARIRGIQDVRLASASNLQAAGIAANEFDAAFSQYVLNWIADDPRKPLQEIYRCLKPGGLFVTKFCANQCVSSMLTALTAIINTYGEANLPVPIYLPTANEYRVLLEQQGFEIEVVEEKPITIELYVTLRQYIDSACDAFLGDWGDVKKRTEVYNKLENSMKNINIRNGRFYMNYSHLNVVARKPQT